MEPVQTKSPATLVNPLGLRRSGAAETFSP
jgi:hypothetical protein